MPSCKCPTLTGLPSPSNVVITSGKVASRVPVAAFDRHVFVHDMEHEIALACTDRDGADVEGAFGVVRRLCG